MPDTDALEIYLAILYQDRRGELINLGLDDVVQKRRHPRARKILITTEEVLEPGERTVSKFLPPPATAYQGGGEADDGIGLGGGHLGSI